VELTFHRELARREENWFCPYSTDYYNYIAQYL